MFYKIKQIEAYAVEEGSGGGYVMKFTYDPRYNVAYIRFHGKGTDVEALQIRPIYMQI